MDKDLTNNSDYLMSRLILIPPNLNSCRCYQPLNPLSSNSKLLKLEKKISNDYRPLKPAWSVYQKTSHWQYEVENLLDLARSIGSCQGRMLHSLLVLEPIVSILPEDLYHQQSRHPASRPRRGTSQCRPLRHVHLLSLVRQLHQAIHLRDQTRSRNAVHRPDLELIDLHHQLLPLLVIIVLHRLASLGERMNH